VVRNEREGLEGEIKKKKTWCCILRGNSMKEWETKRIKIIRHKRISYITYEDYIIFVYRKKDSPN